MNDEFENKKTDLKSEIKENLDKAIEFQKELKKLTGRTLEELEKMSELSKKFKEFYQEAEERVTSLEKDLEEKSAVPEGEKPELEGVDFEQLLTKAKEIKDLLRKPGEVKAEEEEKVEEEAAPTEPTEEAPAEEISPLEAMDETIKMKAEEKVEMEPVAEEKREPAARGVGEFPKRRTSDALEILEKYKKTEPPEEDGEVFYYENNDRKILDSECVVAAISNHLEEAEKLYEKLTETESPIDQFFVKQEIIRSQESLRGIILTSIRMLEKESYTLPQYTIGMVNMDVLKEILEKLSMQNWSKQDDFNLFSEYGKKISKDFYARISSLVSYLKSIIDELGISFA